MNVLDSRHAEHWRKFHNQAAEEDSRYAAVHGKRAKIYRDRGDEEMAATEDEFANEKLKSSVYHAAAAREDLNPLAMVPGMVSRQPFITPPILANTKAYGDLPGSDIRDDGVTAVYDPQAGGPLRMVARPGQPTAPQKPNVPIELEHFVKIEMGEE